ncbi:hypothetical protein IJV79_01210 [bacterium]|nr:hypothetical protein [bacterium]
MDMDMLFEEELVEFAEVSGFDLKTGGYLKDVNLLKQEVLEERSSMDILNMVKSVFVKQKEVIM